MGELHLPRPVTEILERARITDADVAALRADVFKDGAVSRNEADLLFALDTGCAETCDAWVEFFVEALVDYIVHQEQPQGYVSADNAQWLTRAISRDGVVDTVSEMELLVRCLEAARSAPDTLSAFALKQVAHAVLDGKGALARGGALASGTIGEAEVNLMRRVLYAFGGEGNVAITRAEAEILFDLNDRTSEAGNHPSWSDLFVKAVANYLMCASGYNAPTRAEALRRDAFLDNTDASVSGFLSSMVSGGFGAVLSAYRRADGLEEAYREANDARRQAATEAERIDRSEARWLAERIGRDGVIHENEKALLRFLREESPDIHPDLQTLLQNVA